MRTLPWHRSGGCQNCLQGLTLRAQGLAIQGLAGSKFSYQCRVLLLLVPKSYLKILNSTLANKYHFGALLEITVYSFQGLWYHHYAPLDFSITQSLSNGRLSSETWWERPQGKTELLKKMAWRDAIGSKTEGMANQAFEEALDWVAGSRLTLDGTRPEDVHQEKEWNANVQWLCSFQNVSRPW